MNHQLVTNTLNQTRSSQFNNISILFTFKYLQIIFTHQGLFTSYKVILATILYVMNQYIIYRNPFVQSYTGKWLNQVTM